MRIDVLSIFPEYLQPLTLSLIGKAVTDGAIQLAVTDPRDFTTDRHRTVDDTPYGGGAGMVMKPEPWTLALESLIRAGNHDASSSGMAALGADPGSTGTEAGAPAAPHAAGTPERIPATTSETPGRSSTAPVLVVPSPAGEVFTQQIAYELAAENHLIFACGRYEGIDERFIDNAQAQVRVRPLSLGDYVLNGGEVAVLAMVEAVTRLIPGVIGNPESLAEESHTGGLLEYPVYTKPSVWRARPVPDVLLSGHHGRIERWRRDQQLTRTARRRPDMILSLNPAELDTEDLAVLAENGFHIVAGSWHHGGGHGATEAAVDMP